MFILELDKGLAVLLREVKDRTRHEKTKAWAKNLTNPTAALVKAKEKITKLKYEMAKMRTAPTSNKAVQV